MSNTCHGHDHDANAHVHVCHIGGARTYDSRTGACTPGLHNTCTTHIHGIITLIHQHRRAYVWIDWGTTSTGEGNTCMWAVHVTDRSMCRHASMLMMSILMLCDIAHLLHLALPLPLHTSHRSRAIVTSPNEQPIPHRSIPCRSICHGISSSDC